MAARQEPAPQAVMMNQQNASSVGMKHQRRAGDVAGWN
jgi:hypothetical protein